MSYTHKLSKADRFFNVTLSQVQAALPYVEVDDNVVFIPKFVKTPVAASVARCVFSGKAVTNEGRTEKGWHVYSTSA